MPPSTITPEPAGRPKRWPLMLELAGLAALAALLGSFTIPACWTSNALNPGFTGWCVGLARHLEGGRLYTSTAHLPLSPLPFVLLHWLSPTGKTWLLESAAHFVSIAVTLLLMHVVLRRLFRPPVPIVTSLLAATFFFSNEITLLYNSMPQVFVAAGCLFAVCLRSYPVWQAIGLGIASALCLMTKQTPGLGLVAGVLVSYAMRRDRFQTVLRDAALYVAITLAATLALVWLLSPYLDTAGFVHDVLLTGSEPKGGKGYLLRCMLVAGAKTVSGLMFLAFLAVFANGILKLKVASESGTARENEALLWRFLAGLLAAAAVVIALTALGNETFASAVNLAAGRISAANLTLKCGYLVLVGFVSWHLLFRQSAGLFSEGGGAVAIAVAACLFHSLSVAEMDTWFTDQTFQPMNVLALGVVVYATLEGCRGLDFSQATSRWPRLALLGTVAAWLCLVSFQRGCLLVHLLRGCSRAWPEVAYLSGARLKAQADGLRALVKEVRNLTPPEGELLVLPGDPNLEAMIDRQRTPLSCLIVFTDQYWVQYLEEDLQRLRERAPKVILVGPRDFMNVSPQWSPGASQFIERVRREILPARYTLRASPAIMHRGVEDHYDLYVLNQG